MVVTPGSLQGASASEVSGIQEVAASAIADFARFQDIFQFDLADSPAITQLSDSSQHAALHRLLAILLQGDVQASTVSGLCLPLLTLPYQLELMPRQHQLLVLVAVALQQYLCMLSYGAHINVHSSWLGT